MTGFKKIVAVSKELQLYFQLKGDGGSSPPFSAICMFPSKNFTLVNGLNDKEENGQPPGYPVPFPAGFLGTSKHLAGSLLLLLSRKWPQDCLYHKHVERSLLGLPQPLPARSHSASPSICQCRCHLSLLRPKKVHSFFVLLNEPPCNLLWSNNRYFLLLVSVGTNQGVV